MKAKRKERGLRALWESEGGFLVSPGDPQEGSAPGLLELFAELALQAVLMHLLSVSLQMDEQLRLGYNFSPEVEFRAVRSLTLGKVTGLYASPHLSSGLCYSNE